MITKDKLKIYKRYNGDIDGWARSGSKQEKTSIDDSDWYMIDQFIQDLKLIKKGLAAETYATDVYKKLNDNCDNIETLAQIQALSNDNKDSQPGSFVNRVFNLFRSKK